MAEEKKKPDPVLIHYHARIRSVDPEETFSLSFEIWKETKELALERVKEVIAENYKGRVFATLIDDAGRKVANQVELGGDGG